MFCPFCHAEETKVIDSRLSEDGSQVRRRRECIQCSERFNTFERAELNLPRIIKRDGSRVSFDEGKLRSGILHALEKRPVDMDAIDQAISRIIHQLCATGEREIPSYEVGEKVMEELRKLDQVAYVRFASVYRAFQDINEFQKEIHKLLSASHGEKTESR